MASKTISIDKEAYDRLRAVRRPDESFSQAIKRVVRKPISADEFFARINALGPMDDDVLQAIEQSLGDRGASSSFQEATSAGTRHNRVGGRHGKGVKARATKAYATAAGKRSTR